MERMSQKEKTVHKTPSYLFSRNILCKLIIYYTRTDNSEFDIGVELGYKQMYNNED